MLGISFGLLIIILVAIQVHYSSSNSILGADNGSTRTIVEEKCDNYFIDLGTNNGISVIDFLYPDGAPDALTAEIQKRSARKLASVVKKYGWHTQPFCVRGFEANSRYDEELNVLQAHLREKGQDVMFYTRTAVSDKEGEVAMKVDDNRSSVGSSIMLSKINFSAGDTHIDKKVPTIDFSRYMFENYNTNSTVVVKVDIEGAEYILLRHLISTGAFCHRDKYSGKLLIDYLLLEFHGDRINMAVEIPTLYNSEWNKMTGVNENVRQARVLNKVLLWMIEQCGVTIVIGTD